MCQRVKALGRCQYGHNYVPTKQDKIGYPRILTPTDKNDTTVKWTCIIHNFCHSILYIFDNIIYTIYLCVCRWISGFNQVELELIQHHQTNNRMWYENVMKQFYNIASILLNQWRRTEIERGGARLSSPSPVPTYMWMTAVFQCLHRNHYLQLFAFNI